MRSREPDAAPAAHFARWNGYAGGTVSNVHCLLAKLAQSMSDALPEFTMGSFIFAPETGAASSGRAATGRAARGARTSPTATVVRTQRALQILQLLQAGQIWSTGELAQTFNISTRTVFRDLQLLRDCGIPVQSPAGERGGHQLAHDFFWKPVRPTQDELTALVVGSRLAAEALPQPMARLFEAAVQKVISCESPVRRQRLAEASLRIDPPHGTATSSGQLPDLTFMPRLLESLVDQLPIEITLQGQLDKPLTPLKMIPQRLDFIEGHWVLVGNRIDSEESDRLPISSIAEVRAVKTEPIPAAATSPEATSPDAPAPG